ncbi:carbohydrate-binding domain-containing protein [Christensenellaceae bacterium OttesenSCG-928-K19]|nr:carbohydrate-binding domain-containing protein [Christensenellaceae bacterium OttesenSCG-928-K19]
MRRILIVVMIGIMLAAVSACTGTTTDVAATSQQTEAQQDVSEEEPAQEETATEADTQITLSDDGGQIDGDGATQDGSTVQITKGGTYRITGTLSDGSIVVSAPGEDITLLLAGTSISNTSGPAILVQDAQNATITLEDGTENNLSDGGDSDYDAALYGVVSLTINGNGALNVLGNVEEGIASDGNVTIDSGSINIESKDDGINASEDGVSEIFINGGNITINAGGDGIDSNGAMTITGGIIVSSGAVSDANGGLDADGTVTLSGGVVLATGANNAIPTEGAQKFISVGFDNAQAAGSTISIMRDGKELFSAQIPQTYQSVLYSDAVLAEGVTYDFYIDGELIASTDTQSVSGGMGGPGGMGANGEPPEIPDGEMPEGMPEPPEGEMPEMDGERPQIPTDGERPDGQPPTEDAA